MSLVNVCTTAARYMQLLFLLAMSIGRTVAQLLVSKSKFSRFTLRQSLKAFSGLAGGGSSSNSLPPMVYSNEYSCTWPDNHRFPMSKFHDLFDYLTQDHAIDPKDLIEPIHPFDDNYGENDIMRAARDCHDHEYLERVLSHTLSDREKRRVGLYDRNEFADLIPRRSFAEVGGTVLTVDLALKHGIAVNLSGGTHHAAYKHGSGFCVINDIAIACHRALSLGLAQKILVFDCDVHQGDGTATLFQGNENVYTVSLHCEENFPFTKAISDIDVGLPPGTSDEIYIQTCEKTLLQAIQNSQPDVVIYDAGVDVSNDDALGKLSLTDDGIYQREMLVLTTCRQMNIPIAGVIGGGYSKGGKRALASKHAKLHLAAIEVWNTFKDDLSLNKQTQERRKGYESAWLKSELEAK